MDDISVRRKATAPPTSPFAYAHEIADFFFLIFNFRRKTDLNLSFDIHIICTVHVNLFKDWHMHKRKKGFFMSYSKLGRSKKILFLSYELFDPKENLIYANKIPQMTYICSMCKWKAVTDLLRINNIAHLLWWILLCDKKNRSIEGVPCIIVRTWWKNHLDRNQK